MRHLVLSIAFFSCAALSAEVRTEHRDQIVADHHNGRLEHPASDFAIGSLGGECIFTIDGCAASSGAHIDLCIEIDGISQTQ